MRINTAATSPAYLQALGHSLGGRPGSAQDNIHRMNALRETVETRHRTRESDKGGLLDLNAAATRAIHELTPQRQEMYSHTLTNLEQLQAGRRTPAQYMLDTMQDAADPSHGNGHQMVELTHFAFNAMRGNTDLDRFYRCSAGATPPEATAGSMMLGAAFVGTFLSGVLGVLVLALWGVWWLASGRGRLNVETNTAGGRAAVTTVATLSGGVLGGHLIGRLRPTVRYR